MDSLIGLGSVSFPASVALLIVLFFALVICETILGDRRTKKLVHIVDIPVSVQNFQIIEIDSWGSRPGLPFGISTCSSRLRSVSAS